MEIIHRRAGVTRGARSALACILAVVALPVADVCIPAERTVGVAREDGRVFRSLSTPMRHLGETIREQSPV